MTTKHKKLMQQRVKNVVEWIKKNDKHVRTNVHVSTAIGGYEALVSCLLRGHTVITSQYLIRFKKRYNINPNYLLGLSDKMFYNENA